MKDARLSSQFQHAYEPWVDQHIHTGTFLGMSINKTKQPHLKCVKLLINVLQQQHHALQTLCFFVLCVCVCVCVCVLAGEHVCTHVR